MYIIHIQITIHILLHNFDENILVDEQLGFHIVRSLTTIHIYICHE